MSKNHVLHSFLEMLLFLFCPFLVFAVPPPPVSGARRTRPAGGAVAGGPQHAAHRRGRQGLSTERGGRREEQQPRDGWTTGKKLHLRSRGEGGECFQVGEPGAEGELGVFFFQFISCRVRTSSECTLFVHGFLRCFYHYYSLVIFGIRGT